MEPPTINLTRPATDGESEQPQSSKQLTTNASGQLPRLFCGAPWLESVVRINGDVFPCARIEQPWGNVETQLLTDIWHSPAAQNFRKSVNEGRAPSATCIKCYRDRTMTTLGRTFDGAIAGLWINYETACQSAGIALDGGLCEVMPAFHTAIRDASGTTAAYGLSACRALIIALFRGRRRPHPPAARKARKKLRIIAWASIDFLRGRLAPRCLATHRQVNLVAVCNARCIYCIGLFNREIIEGEPIHGQRYKRIATAHVARAFEHMRDITSFFMNGSEFLLYPDWRGLVAKFADLEISLRFSTNGMLLTPDASRYLINSRVLQDLNVSMDGARKETVERVRPMVRFDVVMQHVQALFATVAGHPNCHVPLSLSMVLLRSNLHEAPALIALADRLRAGRKISLHVNFQGLNPSRQAGYAEFYDAARVDISDPRVGTILCQAAELGHKLGIPTFFGYNGSLDEALNAAASSQATRPVAAVRIVNG